ncbi:MAG: serine protease, partial [Myxococcota bacterium]
MRCLGGAKQDLQAKSVFPAETLIGNSVLDGRRYSRSDAGMRVLLLCLGVLGLPEIARAASPAEIKSNVVIVRPRFVDKTRATFTRMAADYEALSERLLAMRGVDKRFTRAQLEQLAATIKGLANRFRLYAGSPGHGSGWIWMPNPQSKTAFVVTNEHVAGQAISVSIEFGRRSDHLPIEGEVVFVSRTTDLALIAIDRDELPASADGLELQTRGLAEGDTVYASGFPGTYTRRGLVPTYSLTNGIISNADFDTGADDGLTLTHTATIDPGNSGGPLLVRGRSGAFEVVGMNTAIGTQRRNLNYAIPGRLIGQDLTRATEAFRLRSSPQELDNALQKTAESLAIELGSASPNTELLSSLISYTYVSERPDMLTRPIEMGIKGELDERVFQLALQRPLEVARILLLDESSR